MEADTCWGFAACGHRVCGLYTLELEALTVEYSQSLGFTGGCKSNGSVRADWNKFVKSPEYLAQEYVFCKWELLICVCVSV